MSPPDTSFGDAWESLCYELLAAEHGGQGLLRLRAPDGGIDILRRPTKAAFQCKSDERGALGSPSALESIKSLLKAALDSQPVLEWASYTYATNANYTGGAVKSIISEAASLGLDGGKIEFLGPEHWDGLCSRHAALIKDRFDFRVTVTEAQVVEAFRKARYYDNHVNRFADLIYQKPLVLKIKDNWTPVELDIPFARELTVGNCVDVVQELLGVSLKRTNFSDPGTSASPSISLTVDRHGQSFRQTIGELQTASRGNELVFWITLVWKDETEEAGLDERLHPSELSAVGLTRSILTESQRRERTLRRAEEAVQCMIWNAAIKLKGVLR